MEIYIDKILKKWGQKVAPDNADLTNSKHLSILSEVLTQNDWQIDAIFEFIQNITERDIVKNKESGNVYDVKLHNPDTQDLVKKNASPEDIKSASDEGDEQSKRIIAGKDKTLKRGDPTKSEEFKKELEPSAEEFDQRNGQDKNPGPPPDPFKFNSKLYENKKFPVRYLKVLERMVNTQISSRSKKWSHFSDIEGGQGRISAQAGELMTMIGVSLSDEEFTEFTDTLNKYVQVLLDIDKERRKLGKPQYFYKRSGKAWVSNGKQIIDNSWIQASINNRAAILKRIQNEYPSGQLMATSWDVKGEVEALGLSDYEKNKGFSSDMYIKIRTSSGEEILDEISLKKSVVVNFLNSGTGKFLDWDENLPDDINPNVYNKNERAALAKVTGKLGDNILTGLSSDDDKFDALRKMEKVKRFSFEKSLEDFARGRGSRAKGKVLITGIKIMAKSGNQDALDFLEDVQNRHREYQKNSIIAIIKNEKLKSGMMNEIRTEFPLKAVSEGEESMAIGPNSLDRSTMKDIFGTSDYDQIKEHLIANPGPPPFIGYQARIGDEILPLAEIIIREDGVGYGGVIKFEMKLHSKFAKRLEQAHFNVYGGNE